MSSSTHTHTHMHMYTHTYISIYIWMNEKGGGLPTWSKWGMMDSPNDPVLTLQCEDKLNKAPWGIRRNLHGEFGEGTDKTPQLGKVSMDLVQEIFTLMRSVIHLSISVLTLPCTFSFPYPSTLGLPMIWRKERKGMLGKRRKATIQKNKRSCQTLQSWIQGNHQTIFPFSS